MTIQIKAIKKYFPVVYRVVVIYTSVNKISKCHHSNDISRSTFLWCCLLSFTMLLTVLNVCGCNPEV